MRHFGSFKRLREASLEDLKASRCVPESVAEELYRVLARYNETANYRVVSLTGEDGEVVEDGEDAEVVEYAGAVVSDEAFDADDGEEAGGMTGELPGNSEGGEDYGSAH